MHVIFSRPKFGLGHSYSWPEFVEKLLKNPMEDKEWQTAKKAAGDHWEPFWKVCHVLTNCFYWLVDFISPELKPLK